MHSARHSESAKAHVAAQFAFREDQKRRHLSAALRTRMSESEYVSQYLVASPPRLAIMELESRPPIVAVIEEEPIFLVDGVGPVGLGQGRVEDDDFWCRCTPREAKTTLIASSRQRPERLPSDASTIGITLVSRIDDEIGGGQS